MECGEAGACNDGADGGGGCVEVFFHGDYRQQSSGSSRRAAAKEPLWDWLGQVDDDTYLCLPRLLPHLSRRHAATLIGRSRGGVRCPGGAGYFLRRAAVQAILDHADEIPAMGRDDELITRCAVRHGHSISDLPALHQNADETVPAPELRRAHRALDAAVDAAYGRKFADETARVSHLFTLYEKLVRSEHTPHPSRVN